MIERRINSEEYTRPDQQYDGWIHALVELWKQKWRWKDKKSESPSLSISSCPVSEGSSSGWPVRCFLDHPEQTSNEQQTWGQARFHTLCTASQVRLVSLPHQMLLLIEWKFHRRVFYCVTVCPIRISIVLHEAFSRICVTHIWPLMILAFSHCLRNIFPLPSHVMRPWWTVHKWITQQPPLRLLLSVRSIVARKPSFPLKAYRER